MRRLPFVLILALPLTAAAQEPPLPEGWRMRLDRAGAPADNVVVRQDAPGALRVTLGPSAIFYRPADVARGSFRYSATFEQQRATRHAEGFGLLVGGRELEGAAQDYLYFLVRQDGRFLVKHRGGDETHTLFDWTVHPAIRRLEGDGTASNTLAIEADDAGARFLVNGVEVARLPRVSQLNTDGVVGLRVNHGLDLRVSGVRHAPAD